MHEFVSWHDHAVYINGWLVLGLALAVSLGLALGRIFARWVDG